MYTVLSALGGGADDKQVETPVSCCQLDLFQDSTSESG